MTGTKLVGGLVGDLYEASIIRSFASGNVTGNNRVGGLVGTLFGSEIRNSYSAGIVNGASKFGGFAGSLESNPFDEEDDNVLVRSFLRVQKKDNSSRGLSGDPEPSLVLNSYSFAEVAASGLGFLGYVEDGTMLTVTASFWDVETSKVGSVDDNNFGATGKTTAQMKSLPTFTSAEWDIAGQSSTEEESVWIIKEPSAGSRSYPYLRNIVYDSPGTTPLVNPIPGLEEFINFSLAENGVTVLCADAQPGDQGIVTINGQDVIFTKVIDKNEITEANAATSCVSGITDLSFLFSNKNDFNADIGHWDVSSVSNMQSMFAHARSFNRNLNYWDVSNVTNMEAMFIQAYDFNGDISAWDVSKVTNMKLMFASAESFNGNISGWSVNNVTDMAYMFESALSFNQDLNDWNVSNVTDMTGMFSGATAFNGDISDWNVENVTSMAVMFASAESFNGDISDWNVSKVENMGGMFPFATSFNGDISKWNVGNVKDMNGMFAFASSFNRDISDWNVSKVENMLGMFLHDLDIFLKIFQVINPSDDDGRTVIKTSHPVSSIGKSSETIHRSEKSKEHLQQGTVPNAGFELLLHHAELYQRKLASETERQLLESPPVSSFNQDISEWKTGNVKNMIGMFGGAKAFNADISEWDVSEVTDMRFMFENASAFNQDLSDWDIQKVAFFDDFITNSGMTTENYDALLIGWAALEDLQENVIFGARGVSYSQGAPEVARQHIIDEFNWTFIDIEVLSTEIHGTEGWRFLASPVQNATYAELLSTIWTQGMDGANDPRPTSDPNVLVLNAEGQYVRVSNLNDVFQPASGAVVYVFADSDPTDPEADKTFPKTLTVRGNENIGTVTASGLNSGSAGRFSIVGNPFNSTIQFSQIDKENLAGVVFVYDYAFNPGVFENSDADGGQAGGGFRAWNGLAGSLTSGHITPFQSFLVYTLNGEAPVLSIPPSAKVPEELMLNSGNEILSETEPKPVLQLAARINQAQMSDVWFSFTEDGVIGNDPNDAVSLYPLDYRSFLSLFVWDNGRALDIKNLPLEWVEPITFPLYVQAWEASSTGYVPMSGQVELVWPVFDNIPEEWGLALLDTHTGEVIDLRQNNGYTFDLVTTLNTEETLAYKMAIHSPQISEKGSQQARFELTITPQESTDIPFNEQLPRAVTLYQNYPNPFNPSTQIRFEIPETSHVRLEIFNITGQRVATVVNGTVSAGAHTVSFNASSLSSGVYLYRLTAGNQVKTLKMVYTK